jgi:hypothetical protein
LQYRFRYAQCQLDQLVTLRTTRQIEQALYNLPTDINEIYVQILLSIPESDRHLAQESLFAVLIALRPLTLAELGEAAVFSRHDKDIDIDDDMRLPDPVVLIDICQGLIELDAQSNTVVLAHSSVRTFLTSTYIKDSKADWYGYTVAGIHDTMANKCLNYLMLDAFKSGVCDEADLEIKLQAYPFLSYAAKYWPMHARLTQKTLWSTSTMINFCNSHHLPNGGNFSAWVQILIPDAPTYQILNTQPLYYAASYGLTDLVRTLLSSKSTDIEAPGGRFESSPLHVAVFR